MSAAMLKLQVCSGKNNDLALAWTARKYPPCRLIRHLPASRTRNAGPNEQPHSVPIRTRLRSDADAKTAARYGPRSLVLFGTRLHSVPSVRTPQVSFDISL